MKKFIPFLIITLIFTGLFIFSNPYRKSDLSWKNTAHIFMLSSLELYQQDGIAHYHFAAVQTWQEPDSLKRHYFVRLLDKSNNNYYISHPPFAFIANHYIINILGLKICEQTLKNIVFFLLLLGGLLIYFTAKLSIKSKIPQWADVAGLIALTVYVFNPVNLYAHIYHNFSEIWGQFFLITSLLTMQIFFNSNRSRLCLSLFGISVFLLAYSDWMGITFLIASAILFFKERSKKHIKRLIFIALIAVTSAVSLTFWQYSSIGGVDGLYHALGIRFVERSGLFGEKLTDMGYHLLNGETWILFLNQIHNVLAGPGYLLLLLLLAKYLFFKNISFIVAKSTWIAFFTATIFAIVVFSATVTHYIYMARFTPFIALLAGNLAINTLEINKYKKLILSILIIIIPLSFLWSLNELKIREIAPDSKQLYLDKLALQIQQNHQHELKLTDHFIERDIMYLTYKTKMNLVWVK